MSKPGVVTFKKVACEKCAAVEAPRGHCMHVEWGLFGPLTALVLGAEVDVVKADGSTERVEVGDVLWSGRKNALARIGDQPPRRLLP